MNVLFINYSHPDLKHVSSLRLYSFAVQLASLGHRSFIITKSLDHASKELDIEKLEQTVNVHNWKVPFLMEISAKTNIIDKLRKNSPAIVRKIITLFYLLFFGSSYPEWLRSVKQYHKFVIKFFKPDLVYATFVPLDSWMTALKISRNAMIPLILDIKDPWEVFIPYGLRRILTRRFSYANNYTSNSIVQAQGASHWIKKNFNVIYSGIHLEDFNNSSILVKNQFQINLIGSIYHDEYLRIFVDGFRKFLDCFLKNHDLPISFYYFGADIVKVQSQIEKLNGKLKISILGYAPLREMIKSCELSDINCYINDKKGFRHKLLELVACGKPVMVIPFENEESINLATSLKNPLFICDTEESVSSKLKSAFDSKLSGQIVKNSFNKSLMANYSWEAQTEKLIEVFLRSTSRS